MSKKISLENLIRKDYIKNALYPILIVELILLIGYFLISNYLIDKKMKFLLNEKKSHIQDITHKEVKNINHQISHIDNSLKILQFENRYIFENRHLFKIPPNKEPVLEVLESGVLFKTVDNNGSSLFFSKETKFDEKLYKKIVLTEHFDRLYKEVTNSNDNIVATYFLYHDDGIRYYPFMSDFYKMEPTDLNIQDFNVYYLADEKHNPNRDIVWSEAYLDVVGNGWMISALAPVYNGEFLEGVVGIDITIDKIVDNILNIEILNEMDGAFVIDSKGTILAMTSEIEKLLKLKELKKHSYDKVIDKTITKPEIFNIFKNKNLKEIEVLRDISLKNRKFSDIKINEREYFITQEKIDDTNWKIFILIDKENILKPINELKTTTLRIGYLLIAFMVTFYLMFFIYLIKKSKTLSTKIALPIENLAILSTKVTNEIPNFKFINSGVKEIDILANNFNIMLNKIRESNDNLKHEIEIEVEKNRQKDQLILQQSKLLIMGEMLSMIAHQWRQPLNALAIAIQDIQDAYEYKELDEKYLNYFGTTTMKIIQKMSDTIDNFRHYFKPNTKKEQVAIKELMDSSVAMIEPILKTHNINISMSDCKCLDKMSVYSSELMQVFLNIINNAKDILIDRKVKNPQITIRGFAENDFLQIEISDNGGGVKKEIEEKIFEPYFSTKGKNGTGLGLYMAKIIIEEYSNGSLTLKNSSSGATFIIKLHKN